MVIQPKIRGFICTTAHPVGCRREVEEQVQFVKKQGAFPGPKRVLVVGGSTGYGLASRIALAFGGGAKTIGVSFDKPPRPGHTATAGWYNTAAFEELAAADGLWAKSFNADAFSDATKQQVIGEIRRSLGQIDLLVYSVASPVRVDPRTGVKYSSVIKPIGKPFSNKTINVATRVVSHVTVQPATDAEVRATVAVMGGDDWKLWIDALSKAGVLAQGFQTIAYTYIGPDITHAVYRDGSMGAAKKDLAHAATELSGRLSALGGRAFLSVNKAVVTQASSAIPVVPLYVTILFRVMKRMGLHEGCIGQMYRLFAERVCVPDFHLDPDGYLHLDDREMRPDVQQAVRQAWEQVDNDNVEQLADLDGYDEDFRRLFGFSVPGLDDSADVDELKWIPSVPRS